MDVFAALADPVRRELLRRLVDRPARVVDLAAEHAISRPAISRHLRVLGEGGLVEADNWGRERHYRLTPLGLAPVRALLAELSPTALPATDPVQVPGPRFTGADLDALDLEVRRTVHERSDAEPAARHTPMSSADDQDQEETG